MSDETKLLPCPWCGKPPSSWLEKDMVGPPYWRIHHECDSDEFFAEIDAGGFVNSTEESAAKAWNRRAFPSDAAIKRALTIFYQHDKDGDSRTECMRSAIKSANEGEK